MLDKVRKRDGKIVKFNTRKIAHAIQEAAKSVGGTDMLRATKMARQVAFIMESKFADKIPSVEDVSDTIEDVLVSHGCKKTSKAFILYRERRANARNQDALIQSTCEMFDSYIDDSDWMIKENASMQKSVNGLNNYVREKFTRYYWLNEVYPVEVKNAHESGDLHIHDLGFFGSYCAGWSLEQLLIDGFGGVENKVQSGPAKHLRSFLGQIVNSTFTTQGECAGAQAWSSIDTYCAPFIRKDKMTYAQVKQAIQEFVYNLNVPTRVGFQCPFSNLTFDLKCPSTLANKAVIIGGEYQEETYKDFQKEMDIFNKAFCEVMAAGDADGRVFAFPIPTLNVTKDFPWGSDSVKAFMEVTRKYGLPYFANYVNSELSPEDAVSMCCFSGDTKFLWKSSDVGVKCTTFKDCFDMKYRGNKENFKVFHNGSWVDGKVIKLPNRKMYRVVTENNKELVMTDNHINVTLSGEKQTSELTTNDYLMFNTEILHAIPEHDENLSYEQGFVVGAFLGDGSFGSEKNGTIYETNFSQNAEKYPLLAKMIDTCAEQMGIEQRHTLSSVYNNVYPVRIWSKELVAFIQKWTCWYRGTYAHNKKLNLNVLTQSEEFRKGILDGWYNTDGGNRNRCYTTSKELVDDMEILITSLGMQSIINVSDRTNEPCIIREHEYTRNYPLYCVRWYQKANHRSSKSNDKSWVRRNNSLYFRIKSIEEVPYEGDVYCVECANIEEPYFTLPCGVITHNCRLRLDTTQLRKRGGGLFGSNPLTGSIGVVTINLPRIGYLAVDEMDYLNRLREQMEIAKTSLEIKRKTVEAMTDKGMYPYCQFILRDVKARSGSYWFNHFSTIGLCGMHESLLNLYHDGEGIASEQGRKFAIKILEFMRSILIDFQEETGHVYNLEATPAESTGTRFAILDKQKYEDIIQSGEDTPYYTNSSNLPVGYTSDVFKMVEHQDAIQTMYTGGTVAHLYLAESFETTSQCELLIKRIFEHYKMPYISITPTFSVCKDHKYIPGNHEKCPTCGKECEVYSRITGFIRPVKNWNVGKKAEWKDRKTYVVEEEQPATKAGTAA